MEIETDTLDDTLDKLYRHLLDGAGRNTASRGETREEIGVQLAIRNPRARLSRSSDRGKPFSALGELLWYLTRRNDLDFICRYISKYKDESADGVTVHGGYGPRLFGMRGINQISNVIRLLKKKSTSRRAVVQLFNAEDIDVDYPEIPCTTTMQFLARDDRLHMLVTLRSNDAYKGLPHDVFCFTMLQEMMACALEMELGIYRQFVGSMHLYEPDVESARDYLDEGLHRPVEMPPMPDGNPFGSVIPGLLEVERRIRAGEVMPASAVFEEPYWADLVRLLQVFAATGDGTRLDQLKSEFVSPIYREYLENRRTLRLGQPFEPAQPKLEI